MRASTRVLSPATSFLCAGLLYAAATSVGAQGLPTATPEEAGFSSERLLRIDKLMEDYVKRGVFPGMTVSVARRGSVVYFKSFGFKDVESREPLGEDTIFRVYSMTKPITSVAVMILFEEGHFMLDDPVSRYLPAFEDLAVFTADESDDNAASQNGREMTIRDLLRQTSGLGYGRGDEPVGREYRKLNLLDPNNTLEELVAKLGTVPLYFPPGTQWRYGLSIDVLGRLVEVVSGQSLDEFLQTRLFGPLGMKDTGFSVSGKQVDRFTNVYRLDQAGELLPLPETRAYDAYTRGHSRLLSGGGGLVSTASDYMRFAQMLLNGGELDGVRILGPKTIELMSMNHLPDGVMLTSPKLQGHGYGFAVSVLTDVAKSPTVGSIGDYGWDGAASTYFRIDPKEELVILLMTHRMPCDMEIQVKLKTLVYQAMTE